MLQGGRYMAIYHALKARAQFERFEVRISRRWPKWPNDGGGVLREKGSKARRVFGGTLFEYMFVFAFKICEVTDFWSKHALLIRRPLFLSLTSSYNHNLWYLCCKFFQSYQKTSTTCNTRIVLKIWGFHFWYFNCFFKKLICAFV